jgi:hypothetical protein
MASFGCEAGRDVNQGIDGAGLSVTGLPVHRCLEQLANPVQVSTSPRTSVMRTRGNPRTCKCPSGSEGPRRGSRRPCSGPGARPSQMLLRTLHVHPAVIGAPGSFCEAGTYRIKNADAGTFMGTM